MQNSSLTSPDLVESNPVGRQGGWREHRNKSNIELEDSLRIWEGHPGHLGSS